jgi:hypothetical protein
VGASKSGKFMGLRGLFQGLLYLNVIGPKFCHVIRNSF